MTFWESLKAKAAAWLVPCLLLTLIVSLAATYYEGRKAGEYAVRFHTADSLLSVKVAAVVRADTVYVAKRDTVRVTVTRLKAFRDTLNIHDTIQVMHYTWLSDSVANACSEALNACDSARAASKAEIAALNAKLKLAEHQPFPPFFGGGADAGYDVTANKPALAIEGHAGRTWSLRARAEMEIGDTTRSRLLLFLHRNF